MDTVEIDYTPVYSDFLRVYTRWFLSKFKLFLGIIILLALMCIVFAIRAGRPSALISLLLPIGLSLPIALGPHLSARKMVKQLLPGVRYRFNEAELEITGPEIDSTIGWSNYHEIREWPKDFILSPTPGAVIPFPKHLFHGDEEIQRFRSIVRAGMGEKARLSDS